MKKITTLFIASVFGLAHVVAQTIDASPETQTICTGGSATLSAVVTPGGGGGSAPTNSYAITTVAYAPDPLTAGTSVFLTDDSQTGLLPIGFSFCYFGNTYTNFIIGSNNWIGFQTGETSTWVTTAIPNATGSAPRNTIMGAWQDINPGAGGTVRYALYGTAPFRRLSVSWNNVPMFSCTGQLYSSQIIIYETTNIIETHIANKSLCLTWNSGNAVHGLHNATGTVAFVVPGRNNTQWTVSNEATRFTPNGVLAYTINWYILPANILVGTGSPITVTPPTSPQYYYAEVLSNSCSAPVAGTNTDTVVVLSNTVAVDAGAYTPICAGQTASLSATSATATGYLWSPAGSLSSSTISNPTATPGSTTTYTVSVVDALGCTGTDTVTVALANPIANAGSNVAICAGASTTLNATGGSAFSWSPAAGLSNPAIANPVATPTATTTYTVTVTQGALACTSTASVTVTVNPLPVVDAGAPVSLCIGSTATLNGTGATGYVWSPSGTLSSSTIANPVSSATTTTTYTMVGTDANGCTSTDNVVVTVNPLPTIDAGASVSICPGSNTTLTGTGGTSYLWTPAASLDNASIATPTASPSATTTYTVTGTDINGCSSTDIVTVSVTPISVTASSGTSAICIGSSTTLTAGGAVGYLWSPAGSLSASTIPTPVATPTATTTYTVIGTGGAGCNDTAFVTVIVNPLPTVDAGVSTAICTGTTTTLSGTGATSFVWSPGATLSSTTVSNPTSNATTTTTYTVVGTDANGCSSTDNVTVTVNPLPTIDAGTSLSICPGGSTTLNATGGTNYLWTPAASLDNAAISNPIATPASGTTYTVTGTDINGCSSTDTVTINVSGITITASSAATTICNGSSTTLSGTGGTSYTWSPAGSLDNAAIANPVATPTSTTTYTVIGTAGVGCSDTAFVTINVNALPTISAGSPVSICSGTTTGLTASGGVGYVWSPAGSLTGSTTATPTSSATTTTTYTVVGTDVNGCTSTNSVTVTVNPLPTASAGSAVSICNGSSTTLGASGGGTYSWSPSGTLSSATAASPIATPTTSTTYTVTVTNASGCTATASVVVTVNAVPTATASANVTICNGASTVLTAGGGGTYSWSPAAGLSSTTSATPTASPSATTTYTVSVSNGFCTNTATVTVTVNTTLSMATATITNATCGNSDGTITAGAVTGGGAPFTYSLNSGPSQSSPTFTGLASGSYTLTVTDNAGCTFTQTVVVNGVLGVNASFSASPTSGTSPLTVNLTNTSTGASDYIWDFGDGTSSILTNPSVVYTVNGTYTILLIAYNGSFACADTTTVVINVFDEAILIVPNVFTPNGDLTNDLFVVQSQGIKQLSGTIFNRWGNKIYEWDGAPTMGWDGKHNGKAAEDGTYYYVIKAIGFDDKEYDATGFVQLIK